VNKIIIDNRTSKRIDEIIPHVLDMLRSDLSLDKWPTGAVMSFNDGIYISSKRNKTTDTYVLWEA
jgi:uncharacterized protein YeaC (DUF1315 family)